MTSSPTKVGPPPRRLTPAPAGSPAPTPAASAAPPVFKSSTGFKRGPQKVLIYGGGGIGKSTLASLAPNPKFLDVEKSTDRLDVARLEIDGEWTWTLLRQAIQSSEFDGYETIVIDSMTRAEDLCAAHVLATVSDKENGRVDNLEAFGWGKGYAILHDKFMPILMDLDRHVRAGRNVVLIAHSITTSVPFSGGEDFLQVQPRLQKESKQGRGPIQRRVFEWCDHVLYVGYDVLAKDGKATGAGTRTIYTKERPTHLAKVRELDTVIDDRPYVDETDGAIWPLILATGGAA